MILERKTEIRTFPEEVKRKLLYKIRYKIIIIPIGINGIICNACKIFAILNSKSKSPLVSIEAGICFEEALVWARNPLQHWSGFPIQALLHMSSHWFSDFIFSILINWIMEKKTFELSGKKSIAFQFLLFRYHSMSFITSIACRILCICVNEEWKTNKISQFIWNAWTKQSTEISFCPNIL